MKVLLEVGEDLESFIDFVCYHHIEIASNYSGIHGCSFSDDQGIMMYCVISSLIEVSDIISENKHMSVLICMDNPNRTFIIRKIRDVAAGNKYVTELSKLSNVNFAYAQIQDDFLKFEGNSVLRVSY